MNRTGYSPPACLCETYGNGHYKHECHRRQNVLFCFHSDHHIVIIVIHNFYTRIMLFDYFFHHAISHNIVMYYNQWMNGDAMRVLFFTNSLNCLAWFFFLLLLFAAVVVFNIYFFSLLRLSFHTLTTLTRVAFCFGVQTFYLRCYFFFVLFLSMFYLLSFFRVRMQLILCFRFVRNVNKLECTWVRSNRRLTNK